MRPRPPGSTRTVTLSPYTRPSDLLSLLSGVLLAVFGLTIPAGATDVTPVDVRSEEHTSELQSLMRISHAVFCLKKKTKTLRTVIFSHKHKFLTISYHQRKLRIAYTQSSLRHCHIIIK